VPDPCHGREVVEHWGGGVVVLVHENESVVIDPGSHRCRSATRYVTGDQCGMDGGVEIADCVWVLAGLEVLPVRADSGVLEESYDSWRQMRRARSKHTQPIVVSARECDEDEHQVLTVEPGHRRQH